MFGWMFAERRGPAGRLVLLAFGLGAVCPTTLAYTPGSGTLLTENFEHPVDANWEQGSGNPTSPWTQPLDGADRAFLADGFGPYPGAATKHWCRRFTHPVPATSYSIAFEYRADLGTGYVFDLEVQQRDPALRKYRLRVDSLGSVSLWRTENATLVVKTATANSTIPVNTKRWIRFAIEPDAGGHPWVRARIWSGGATAEPSSGWTLQFLDDLDQIVRVHRFELIADGPKGVKTWIDDLDVFGDGSGGCVSTIKTIYLMEASHLDIGFTDPPDTVEAFYKTSLDQVLVNLDADPNYHWTIENGWQLDRWWDRSTAAERQNMVAHLQAGRLSLCAGYANLHTTTVGPEELSRSVYWSSRFARQNGIRARTWITDDVPGSTFALPELLARSGVEFFIGGMNTAFGGRTSLPSHHDRPFWWVGPDGSRVLSWITFDSYAEGLDYGFSFFDDFNDLYNKLGKKLPEQEEAGYSYPEMLMMRVFDNHYGGFKVRDLVDQWNSTYSTPKFILANPEQFFDVMLTKYGASSFPSFSGDFGAAWSGSHANTQHTEEWVRQAHREGRAAESLLAVASVVDGQPVPQSDLDFLYRRELEVDEHSGAGGWPQYFTPEEMDRNNRIHLGYASDAKDKAGTLLEQGLDRALADLPVAGNAVAAVNPLARSRDGWARLVIPSGVYASSFRVVDRASGVELPYQRFDSTSEILFRASAVPAFGYRVYDLVPGAPTATPTGMLSVSSTTIENDAYRLTLNPADGSLSGLYDKTRGREMIDTGSSYKFNRLGSNVKSEADASSAPVQSAVASATLAVDSTGPLLGAIKVTRTGTPHVETTYRLYRGEDRVEFENVLDRGQMPNVPYSTSWRGYFVTLPFNVHNFNLRTETTTRFLDPFGDGFLRDGVFDWHNAEHTLDFWDGAGGVLYALDSVDAHHFETLSTLTSSSWSKTNALLLSRMYDKSDEYQFEDGSIGPYTIEPGTSSTFRYTHHVRATGAAFDPIAASRFGWEALEPLRPRFLSHRPGNLSDSSSSFFSVDAPGVLLYTVKGADDGDGLVLRLVELTGTAATARISSGTFTLQAPMAIQQDEEGGTPLSMDSGAVVVPLGPYQTATVRLRAATSWAPITIVATKDAAAGSVRLSWSGGVTPFTLRRAEDARFTTGVTTLVDEQNVTSADDPVLADGKSYYYLAY